MRVREFERYTRNDRPARISGWWRTSVVASVAMVLTVALVGAVVWAERDRGSDLLKSLTVSPASFQKDASGDSRTNVPGEPFNVLVLGVDRRPAAEEMGTRTDTIMLLRVFPRTGKLALLSIPRDFYVDVEPGKKDRINAAYAYGGIDLAESAIENYAGVSIDHYAVVDFQGFEDGVDALGGVRLRVQDGLPANMHMKEGVQRLNGRRALKYVRYRGSSGGDLDRIERQQQMIASLRSKFLKWNTVKKLPELMPVIQRNVQTDIGVRNTAVLGQVLIHRGKDATMTMAQLKGTLLTLPDGREVLKPDDQANEALLTQFRD